MRNGNIMALNARTKKKVGEYTLFDVLYEDGSRISNRKVPDDALAADDREAAIRAFLEEQDRKIGETSGKPRAVIKAIIPAGR
jgi:hypothetical protein